MFLAAQYYRPPFPQRRFWADDMSRVRDAGLDGIQLWCVWGWIEGEQPGTFRYDDYDEIIQAADQRGLKVVLSTIAEIHPFWIHREVPGAELVDHLRRPVISCTRNEVNVGLTPGGCFDHPQIAERMEAFLADISARYAGQGNLYGWDCWNETRWNVHADGLTCFCEHTLADFRNWLRRRYGDLDGLNRAWKRRYADWADVEPRKRTGGPFASMIDFSRYQSWRATEHARWRHDILRRNDIDHPITAHGPMPCVVCPPVTAEVPMCRGNDWELADVLSGVGSSHFPISQSMSTEYINLRLGQVKDASQGKAAWVSEIQGSTSSVGYGGEQGVRRGPAPQQRWILDAVSRGYDAMIFWAWRDEVFCREAGKTGLAGNDGHAEKRFAAMRETRDLLNRHGALFDAHQADPPRVGVLWSPDGDYIDYARTGNITDYMGGSLGYAMALERLGVPYRFVEAYHTDVAGELDVLIFPYAQIVSEPARELIRDVLARGGHVLVEAETDAYDEVGFFRYGDERPLLKELGTKELGRRPLPEEETLTLRLDQRELPIPVRHFTTPLAPGEGAEVLARDDDGEALALRQPAGGGTAWVLGSFAGRPY
ncbi:MAG: beta-galactosidase, partial [Planctomycetota bacterium]